MTNTNITELHISEINTLADDIIADARLRPWAGRAIIMGAMHDALDARGMTLHRDTFMRLRTRIELNLDSL